ncbi:PQQ-binding-like beta-propeller repeat protein [Natronococcus sp.]|uniref:outer membrane protein assembly factor BamB family protein n=1 Tax=Natronococcus sp. TaxID=35747 RepID=UPI003A4DEDC6
MSVLSGRDGRIMLLVAAVVVAIAVSGVALSSVGGAEVQPAAGDSWPMEGHDSGQTAFNPNAVGPDGDVGPAWISVTGYGPGITVANDRMFVAGGERRGAVTAYDPAEGSREWRTRLGDTTSSKPIVDGETVYVHVSEQQGRDVVEDRHEVVALDAETGDVEWRFEATDDRYESTTVSWKTLTVADGTLYVVGENYGESRTDDEGGFVLSIDEDGEERWRTDLASHEISRPAVDGGTVVVSTTDLEDELVALDAADGEERWRTEHPDEVRFAAPAVDDGSVYVNARTPLELDAETGEVTADYDVTGTPSRPMAIADDQLFVPGGGSQEWAPRQIYAVERATGAVEWSYGSSSEFSSRPVVSDETVFVGGSDGVMYALDRQDGEERWTYRVNRNYMINNEPAVVGETLYVGPVDNRVYALVEGGDARDPVVVGFVSRFLPVLGDFVGFFAVVALAYLGVGVPFGIVGAITVLGIVSGLRLSRTPLRLFAARLFRTPAADVSRRTEFAGALVASITAVLAVGVVSALTFGAFPFNGLLAAGAVFGATWAVLAYRWLPTHPDDLDREARTIRRQWGVLLAVYGLLVGLLYPLVVFVVLMGIYFV